MIKLPRKPGHGATAMREWKSLAQGIVDGWSTRARSEEKRSAQDTAYGWLKRQSYRVISHYLELGSPDFFEAVVRLEGRTLTGVVKLKENPFHFGLLALFSHDNVLSRQDRSLFALQMLYAYKHRVPPRLLVGFIYQVGSNRTLRERAKTGHIEPGFKNVYCDNIWQTAFKNAERKKRRSFDADEDA